MVAISIYQSAKGIDLCGRWVAEYPFGTEILEIYPNGEFRQKVNVVVDGNSTTVTNKGNWKYDPTDHAFRFEKILVIEDGFGKLKKDYNIPFSGIAMHEVWLNFPWSSIKMDINPDCGYYYAKVKDSKSKK